MQEEKKKPQNPLPGRTPGQAEGALGNQDRPGNAAREPGPTPGSAEGDLETVEEDLKQKEKQEK